MNSIIQYIFEVTLGSSLLFLGFYLFRNLLPLRFKRFYLLGCLALPLIFPLINFDNAEPIITQVPSQVSQVFVETAPQTNAEMTLNEPFDAPVNETDIVKEAGLTFNWQYSFILVYGCIGFILLIRFAISLLAIYQLSKNPIIEAEGKKFHKIKNQNFTGGSFFHFIFINERYVKNPAFKVILSHEHTHLRLFHSLDIVLSELFCICFWINPTAWILKKEIRLNAEYEADHVSATSFGEEHYANTLLNLSITSHNIGPMLSFSAMDTRKRLKNILDTKQTHWFTTLMLMPFLIAATWLISCESEMMDFTAMDPQTAMKNVKTVTTRYISHQKDTQQKDGKVIAVAYYLPDGTIDRVEQHMTYPYDYEKPFKRTFMASPDPVGVLHILDGFGIGEATNNLLYGNDWPRYNKIELQMANSEMYRRSTTIDENDEGLPVKFTLMTELNEDIFYNGVKSKQKGSVLNIHIEEFDYQDGKVISHTRRSETPKSVIQYKNQEYNIGGSRLLTEMNYKYDGEKLIEVSGQIQGYGSPNTTKMNYENGIMTSATYFREDKQYNHREFYYDNSGLKTRTEIFNVYDEPEYTINYDYEYY